jgi:hypothetical protein
MDKGREEVVCNFRRDFHLMKTKASAPGAGRSHDTTRRA